MGERPAMGRFKYLGNRDTSNVFREIAKHPTARGMIDDIFSNPMVSCDIDSTMLYMGGYKHLAQCIPLRMPVYDFGAAYGFQSWHFRKHRKYIGINPANYSTGEAHFRTDNSIWYFGTAQEYFEQFGVDQDSFAIVNAVPDDEVAELVKKHFKYCYIFYV